jgi:hypothetical protein
MNKLLTRCSIQINIFASCRREVSLSQLRAGSTLRSEIFCMTSKKRRMILAFAREAMFIVQRLTESG